MGKAKAVLDEIRKKHTEVSASEEKNGENYFNEEINKPEEKSCYLWPRKDARRHSSIAQKSRYEDTFKKAVEVSAQAPRRRDDEAEVQAEDASEQEQAQGNETVPAPAPAPAPGADSSTASPTHALSA
jgi:hypothetical protein